MAVQTITHTFSAVVGSGGTASANKTIDADNIFVLFVKVEPSILGGAHTFEIFQKDTLLAADLSYKASGFSGDFFDPVEDVSGTETERTEGLVTVYQDDDSTLELHIKITNDDTSTKDFDITVRYITTPTVAVNLTGTPVDDQIAIWTNADTLEGDANFTWDGSLFNITGALTVSGVVTLTTDLAVAHGGTGVSTLTDGGILLGSGSGDITALGVATNGQIPIGDGAGDPVLAVILGTANEVDITNGAGSIQVGLPSTVQITTALGIGGAPATSAGIELSSTTKAVLNSRMNTTERDALTAVDGMILYNTSTLQMEGRVNGAWINLGLGGGGFVDISGTPANDQIAIFTDSDTIEGDTNLTWDGAIFTIGGANGENLQVKRATVTVSTSSGASVTATNLIPAGSFVIGVTTRVTTTVTGPAGYDVGDGTDIDRWGNSILVAFDTTSDITDFTSGALTLFPAANDVVITSDGVAFTGGVIRLVVRYVTLGAPTS